MKELVELLWRGLSQYIPILVAVVRAPRRTILSLVETDEDRLGRALTFSGVTVAIGFLLQAPMASDGAELMTVGGSMIAYKVMAILIFAAVIVAAFRLVGGHGGFETTLCAYLYSIGPLYLALILLDTMVAGALSGYDRDVARAWLLARELPDGVIEDLFTSGPGMAVAITLLLLAQLLITVVWLLVCWRVYRVIHGVSRVRSAIAYVIAFTAVVLLAPMFTLVLRGIHGGILPPIK